MNHSLLTKIILGLTFTVFIHVGLGVCPSNGQTPFNWKLHGTALYDGHAYAILDHEDTGNLKWVGVGERIDQATVVRIERHRVVLFDPRRGHVILTDVSDSEINQIMGLDALLNEEFNDLLKIPTLITENHHVRLLEEITQFYTQGKLTDAATRLPIVYIVPGEEWVTGMRTTVDLPILGLQDQDIIIRINGISPNSSEETWKTISDVIKRAMLITVTFVRGGQVHSNVFEVFN